MDVRNGDGSALYQVASNSATSGWDPVAVSAIGNVQSAYRYFRDAHGRAGIDGNDGNMFAYVHYGSRYDNAFWMGSGMVFGDGGTLFSELAGCLDVVGHEMAHGVVESSANLIYANQSGALNESFADFFGAMIEGEDWRMGEDCTIVAPGFLRNMSDPHQGMNGQPSHMSEFAFLPNTEAGDNGGVHVNSGIPNRAAYLLVEGLTAEGIGTSIGRAKAEALYYRTLTTYLVSSSKFIDLRRGMLLAATDLYPGDSTVEQAVNDAFDAVGISEGNVGTPDDTSPTEADVLAGTDLLLYLYPLDEVYDGVENFQLWMQQLDAPFTGYDPSVDFGPLNADYTGATRPAAFTDEYGTVALYVGADRNLYWNAGGAVTQLTSDGWMWSVAVSDNGRRVAYTVNDATDNGIYVFDPQSGDVQRYELELVDYVSDSVDVGARILYADALDFNYLGNRIAFDAFVCIPTADVPCDAPAPFGYWTIGVLDVNTGSVHYPFSNQAANLNLGYPTFAQNNEYVIAFDMVEYLDDGSIGTATFTFNTETNEFPGNGVDRAVISPGPAMWGVPTFLGDDSGLIFQGLIDSDVGTGYVRISTVKLELTPDFAIDFSAPSQRMNHYESAFPVTHRAVYRDPESVGLDPGMERLDFGDVAPGEVVETSITLTNNSSADVIIYQSDIANNNFSHSLVNTRVPRGESVSGTVRFLGCATEGTYTGGLQIQTDASQAGLTIDLIATVVTKSNDSDDNDQDEDDDTPGSDNDGNLGNTNGDSGGGGGGGPLLWLSLVPLIVGLRRKYRRL